MVQAKVAEVKQYPQERSLFIVPGLSQHVSNVREEGNCWSRVVNMNKRHREKPVTPFKAS